jgi:hypothetical protein
MNISALALYLLGALLVDEVVQPEHSNPRREGPVLLLLVTTKEAVDALAPLGQLILIVLARVVPGPAVSARDCACCAAERVLDAKRPIVVDSADYADAATASALPLSHRDHGADGDDLARLARVHARHRADSLRRLAIRSGGSP